MVRFSLNIKTCCLYVIWEKQDQIWAKFFASPKICTPIHLWTWLPHIALKILKNTYTSVCFETGNNSLVTLTMQRALSKQASYEKW